MQVHWQWQPFPSASSAALVIAGHRVSSAWKEECFRTISAVHRPAADTQVNVHAWMNIQSYTHHGLMFSNYDGDDKELQKLPKMRGKIPRKAISLYYNS